ncbi:hypothetical protein BZZ01_13560 [Nostocales cyanobacterium HT-58-2]|nr:hypothetical protein BZZ01_13560 [Nostocales cyanobacterium HT-58-2]
MGFTTINSDTKVQIRWTGTGYDRAKKRARSLGFDGFSSYVRHLIEQDISRRLLESINTK